MLYYSQLILTFAAESFDSIGLGCPRSGKGCHFGDSFLLLGNTFIPYSLPSF